MSWDSSRIVVVVLTVAGALASARASLAQEAEISPTPPAPATQKSETEESEPSGTSAPATQESETADVTPEPTGEAPHTGEGDAATRPTASSVEKKGPKYDRPTLPEGMTLDQVLDRAGKPPPEAFPDAVPDDDVHAFLLGERLEYRFDPGDGPDHLGLEMQSWFGGDFNRLWLKIEGEGVWQGVDGFAGESATDLLYSRLITPFWYVQIGAQYANEWGPDDYEDLWSAALAIQGMAPGMFEVDLSTYLSEDVDLTFLLEAEYDLRITQRLVLQFRTELGFAVQDIPERDIGAGMTDAVVGLRLRYEVKREFAPYVGGRFQTLVGETADRAEKAGQDPTRLFVIAGVRFAVY